MACETLCEARPQGQHANTTLWPLEPRSPPTPSPPTTTTLNPGRGGLMSAIFRNFSQYSAIVRNFSAISFRLSTFRAYRCPVCPLCRSVAL